MSLFNQHQVDCLRCLAQEVQDKVCFKKLNENGVLMVFDILFY